MKKHLLTLLITIFMCALLTASISAAYPIGDVNNDGVFSVLDILGILTKLSADSLTEDELYTADFNRDGKCTINDVFTLLNVILNTDQKPSYCARNNRYHDNCVWEHLDIGTDDILSYKHASYPDIKLNFKIYIPESYSPNKKYALVTFLHGLGGENMNPKNLSGGTFFSNIKASKYGEDTIYLIPQCPKDMTWPDNRETITVAYELIMSLSTHLSIDKSRLYISGHSNGSKGVAYMLMEHPNTFAAAVMGSGASSLKYYTNLENIATASVWMFIGTADEVSGFYQNVNNLYNALKELGADVKYTEFKGLGHNIFGTVGNTEGLIDWVYSKTLVK